MEVVDEVDVVDSAEGLDELSDALGGVALSVGAWLALEALDPSAVALPESFEHPTIAIVNAAVTSAARTERRGDNFIQQPFQWIAPSL
ncbi:MAG TPA: hypothetical protein PKV27_05855, partial [Ilumatobacteraceae bacterium]|nr:hypothetical protein [Ilumatobacteraceae bacterium]